MLRDRIITKEEVTENEFEMAKSVRNSTGFNLNDGDLLNFYVEWNNVCYTLKHANKKKRR